ncbi:MAG: hypothetical protein B7Z73_18700, partial [Planctomycetia bacterium 21-64-5]
MTTVQTDISTTSRPTAAARWPRRRFIQRACLLAVAVAAAYAGWWAFWHHHAKRFQEVRKGVFYRVAQPSEIGFRYLIDDVGVKTVLSVQLYDFRLHRGLVSFGPPDGCRESEYVEQLGARPVQWPMGVEKSWPWLTPWQFEQFFRLMDDPDNWPVAVHCQGGRHRTGTLYGANALGGAIKYVANAPNLDDFGALGDFGVSSTDHAGTNDNADAMINIPLVPGKIAIRADGIQAFQSSFGQNTLLGTKDQGSARTLAGRIQVLAQINPDLSVNLTAFSQNIHGNGLNVDFRNIATGQPVFG